MNNDETKEVPISSIESDDVKRPSIIAGEEVILDNETIYEEESKTEIKKDTKSNKNNKNKKMVIGIIIVILLTVAATITIFTLLKGGGNGESKDILKDESELAQVDLNATYDGLSYSQNEKAIEEIGFFYDYSKGKEGNKINVKTIEISGLKDSHIQSEINRIIEEKVTNLYDASLVHDNKILYEHVYVVDNVYIFNGVVSALICNEVCDTDGNIMRKYDSINLVLDTMKDIEFKDIFLNSTDIKSLMTQGMIESYDKKDFIYSFSPTNIYIPVDNEVEKINLYENRDKIAIYNRYYNKSKSYFDTYNAKPYVYTEKEFSKNDSYGMITSNLFLDTCNNIQYSKYSKELQNSTYEVYQDALKAIKAQTSSSSKRFLGQIIVDIEELEDDQYKIGVKYNIYEINKEFFDENIIEFIIASENSKGEGEVEYFKNPVMDARQYLDAQNSNIIEKKVDKSGKDILEIINDESLGGIS